ncbi:MAG: hypothetical protein ACKO7W_24945, partial [Elainella sp.]
TQLRRYLQDSGFSSFRLAAIAKIAAGVTTVEEVRRVLPHSAFSTKADSKADSRTDSKADSRTDRAERPHPLHLSSVV